jgi:hypothetical protein
MNVTAAHFDMIVTISVGLLTFFVAMLFILYRQIIYVGKSLFSFKTKVYEDFTVNSEINRRLEIMHKLINENIRFLELEIKHLEEKIKMDSKGNNSDG